MPICTVLVAIALTAATGVGQTQPDVLDSTASLGATVTSVAVPVPEPTALALIGLGLLALGIIRALRK